MKKAWLLNLALLCAVGALGWFIHSRPAEQQAGHALSDLRADAVSALRIERSGRTPMVLAKKDGKWSVTAPLNAPAEPLQVERLLAILGARASARFAADDLARFELDRPAARLTIDGQDFSFGTVSTLTREQYVLTQGAVYTVELRYGAALPGEVTQLLRRRLFAEDELPVSLALPDFTARLHDGRWTLTPAPADLGQDDILHWLDHWRQAMALHSAAYDGRKPVGEIRVEFKDGRRLVLGILQHEPELVLLRPDENLQYSFIADTARRLLTPPAAAGIP